MLIRRFEESDAESVSELIVRTLKISNSADYSPEALEEVITRQTPEDILQKSRFTHFYVVEAECGEIIGCGAIGPYWDRDDESSLFTIFVSPEMQGRGVGRLIVDTLEKDELFLKSKRVEIPASITGLGFYLKMGYDYKNGVKTPDKEGLFRLEKHG